MSHEEILNSKLSQTKVIQMLCKAFKRPWRILRTNGSSLINVTFLNGIRARIEVESRNSGSQLDVSCDFTMRWVQLILITLIIGIFFTILPKLISASYDYYPVAFLPLLAFLLAMLVQKEKNETKWNEAILDKVIEILGITE